MLVILNAIESSGVQYFAREICSALNNFSSYNIDGYTCDFTSDTLTVTSSTGTRVYQSSNTTSTQGITTLVAENTATFNKIIAFQQTILDTDKSCSFPTAFRDPQADWSITSSPSYSTGTEYATLIESYNQRPYENYVIYGSFSRTFVNQITNDVGGYNNVTLVNLIRHPDVAMLMDDSYKQSSVSTVSPFDTQGVDLFVSYLNAVSLSTLTNVNSVKFEAVMSTGVFRLNGTTINTPVTISPYNNWITQEEKNNIVPTLSTGTMLQTYHMFASNDFSSVVGASANPMLPADVRPQLGYAPISDYNSIIN